ncbi:patatin-like phospholipase domain-containing protein [Archangium lipolyticum]|uniref:patatin-like phospholipase family protein n=1 Tax=Archangium lipolyticum TaxID=2970465 RepID=UPI00214A6540|nr:patatin-like phospholipase family protein [Archangium lipolyticum]
MHDTGMDHGCARPVDRSQLNTCPEQKCDLIMKGGVTSGVVYPPAILKLAQRYRFHAIGGASAGSIAAAAAAAAEYGRQTVAGKAPSGTSHGFIRLAELNDELASPGFVRRLFEPSSTCRPLFNAILAWQAWGAKDRKRALKKEERRWQKAQPRSTAQDTANPPETEPPGTEPQDGAQAPGGGQGVLGFIRTVARLNLVCLKSVPVWYILGALVGLLVGALLLGGSFAWLLRCSQAATGWSCVLGWVGVVLMLVLWGGSLLLGGLLASGLVFKRIVAALNDKDAHKFGICPGSRGAGAPLDPSKPLVLTDWLYVRLNELAGRGPGDAPITVSDLKKLKDLKTPEEQKVHGIHFKLVTSNLTLGQPYTLPMSRGSRSFFFKKSEMDRLFPKPVVDALVAWGKKNQPEKSIRIRKEDEEEFFRFPMGEDIPLVVATRLSLSFPVLLSAVRLYSVKHEKYRKQGGVPQTINLATDLEEHWLSDGGITSNFPIHVFDAWVPQHPTFGITLYDSPLTKVLEQREGHKREKNPHDAVLLPYPHDFDKARPQRTAIQDTLGFLRAVFETAQSYRDNAQAGMPSYRERILQLFLDEHEGGLNLDMDKDVIQHIQAKGQCAAQELLERYENTDSVHFSEHRWVRMHVLMAELELQLFEVRKLFPGDTWKEELRARFDSLFKEQVGAQAREGGSWYRNKDQKWCDEARKRLDALLELVDEWDECQQAWMGEYTPTANEDPRFFFAAHPPRPQGVLKVIPNL